MPAPVPLSVLATVDPVLRDAVVMNVLLDAPGTVAVRHDIVETENGGGIRRLVMTADGIVEDVVVPLEHPCTSCAVREDAVPTLRRLAAQGSAAVLLALPVSAESLPAARTLAAETRGGRLARLRLAAVVAAVDGAGFEEDLLGDALLAERDLALTDDDRRAVGEALAAQLGHADVVVVAGDVPPVASDLVDHVRAADSERVDGLDRLDVGALLAHRHDPLAGERRTDPRRAAPARTPGDNGVWTLDLHSDRPFHPERLLDRIEDLGAGPVRGRGVFWVPTRPDSVCVWDGSGGQLSIGGMGEWGRHVPRTRLVITGTGDQQELLREAFEDALVTEDEWRVGLAPWLGSADVLAPWLGDRHPA
ncbi:GTP-binding protein [Cellulomonas carbonis]|uniref:Cobalamin biosynthesis protein CobW n=1 Tax=Cellulomonas carbonis T26 TaxID=947969 RepID=A0A0A0BLH5_9CELL|nr:GTP-binding protein [Cellulomonas carbonis]KGM09373.1 cobalamin biosynthesis protein CobW [Cellulomonas carbonis T26]GGC16097.1 cobalamin biosynthesis protein CobW [Cellulomonas carbonis]